MQNDGNNNADWRRWEAMARRGWSRIQQGLEGDAFNMGGNFRIGRMLAAGDLRLVALYLIEQQPRHGYDLIKAIEDRSAGFYSPSPGIVYPALTFLEEAGYVTSQAEGNKKLYTITESGRAHLADNGEAIDTTLGFLAKAGEQFNRFREFARADWPWGGKGEAGSSSSGPAGKGWSFGAAPEADRDLKDVVPELNEARKAVKAAIKKARTGTDTQQREAAAILRRAAAEIAALGEDDVDI
jgi:DNA-binding PadR family transcriptional regulator